MKFMEIFLTIYLLLMMLQFRRVMDRIKEGRVSTFKIHLIFFLGTMLPMPLPLHAVTKICLGISSGIYVISYINFKGNGSQESREDLRIWTGGLTILAFLTGGLTLMIHIPDKNDEARFLLTIAGVTLYAMTRHIGSVNSHSTNNVGVSKITGVFRDKNNLLHTVIKHISEEWNTDKKQWIVKKIEIIYQNDELTLPIEYHHDWIAPREWEFISENWEYRRGEKVSDRDRADSVIKEKA